MPLLAPISAHMLVSTLRSSTPMASMPGPPNSSTRYRPASIPRSPMIVRIRSLAVTPPRAKIPSTSTRIVCGTRSQVRRWPPHPEQIGAPHPERQTPEDACRARVGVTADVEHPGPGVAPLHHQRVGDPLCFVEPLDPESLGCKRPGRLQDRRGADVWAGT